MNNSRKKYKNLSTVINALLTAIVHNHDASPRPKQKTMFGERLNV